MKRTLNYIFFLLLTLIPLAACNSQTLEQQKIEILQKSHSWNFDADDREKFGEFELEIWVKNVGENRFKGTVVFEVSFSPKGFDKEFLAEFKNVSEKRNSLEKSLKEKVEKEPENKRVKALSNYLDRGFTLKEGMEYEPVAGNENSENFSFWFRKEIEVGVNEILSLKHAQKIPKKISGNLITLNIVGYE